MGLLDNVEKGIEKAVRGAFSRGSKTLQPVEMASHLRRELDDKAMILDAERTLAPNVFAIKLSSVDFDRARSWGTTLAEELCDVVINHSHGQGYILQGPVRVSFDLHPELKAGIFEVVATTEREAGAPAQPSYPSAPPPPPAPRAPAARPAGPAGSNAARRPAPTPPAAVVPQGPGQPVLDIAGQRYALNADSIVLGRSSEADILIDDTGVSRRHLEIRTVNGISTAVDLGSTNGSFLDGSRINGSARLADGSTLSIGRTKITFRVLPARQGGRA
ncbi:FhaA domain-containing protein [Pseudarthrobacter sp. P1]|uniref:FhaA domain-containing protein n=1 Tax=Pseudarthrobacter sp. P1 TaxID=3418418 RepID=UPI003CE905BA